MCKTAFLFISNQHFPSKKDWENHKQNITKKFNGNAVHAHHHKMDSAKSLVEISHYENIIVVFDECPHATIKTKKIKIERIAPGKNISFFSRNSDINNKVEGVTQIKEIHNSLITPEQLQ